MLHLLPAPLLTLLAPPTAAACACRALAAAAADGALWRAIFLRKWDAPHALGDARAEHVARKRTLALLRLAPPASTLTDADAACAAHLFRIAAESLRFERTSAALERAPTLRWLVAAATAAADAARSQACGRLPPPGTSPESVAAGCACAFAALGAVVARLGDADCAHAASSEAFYRVASVLAMRVGGDAGAALCATASLAAAPLAAAAWHPAATPSAGPWPAGARLPHDSAAMRARREAQPGAGPQLLTGAWAGMRMHASRATDGADAATPLHEPLEMLLGLSVTADGAVNGFGRDALGTFGATGHLHAAPASPPQLAPLALRRLSMRVAYRECGGLPGALIAHTVPGAASTAWEAFVWPFGLVGAWAPLDAAGAPQWLQGGTFMCWPHAGGAVMKRAASASRAA